MSNTTKSTEHIPDDDEVSRGCDTPPGLAPESIFPFISSDMAESVYWRKYATTDLSVHERGCARIRLSNKRRMQANQPIRQYSGFVTAKAGSIRAVETDRGFKADVLHLPEDDDIAHSHIYVVHKEGSRFKRNDRMELVHLLCNDNQVFGPINHYSCPRAADVQDPASTAIVNSPLED